MAGLDATGLTVKTTAEVIADMVTAIQGKSEWGPATNTDADGPMGQFFGVVAAQIGLVWQVLQQIVDARDPDAAEGTHLDNLSAVTGVTREAATPSTVVLTLTGTPGTSVAAGSISKVPGGTQFVHDDTAVIESGGTVDVNASADVTGPISGGAGSITEIVTAVSGWASVTNAAAIIPGTNLESDPTLRARREASLQIIGAGPDQAIRARLEALDDVLSAAVISNRTAVTDANGIPPHAFRAVIWPSTADEAGIAVAIYNSQPAGIASDGSTEVAITDDQGFTQSVFFSFATALELHLDITVTTDADYPADGDTQISDALVAVYGSLDLGQDVILLDGLCAVAEIPGVLTAVLLAKFGSAPGGGDNVNLDVALTEIVTIDGANIDVTSS